MIGIGHVSAFSRLLVTRSPRFSATRLGESMRQYSLSKFVSEPLDEDLNDLLRVNPTVAPKSRLRDIINTKSIHTQISPADKSKSFATFSINGTVKEAITHLAKLGRGSSIAIDAQGDVAGIFTSRDIIKFIYNHISQPNEELLKLRITDLVTPKDKVIFCSPDDYIDHCREIMYQHRIRHIPVIENGKVLGLVTGDDLSDSTFSIKNSGGKKAFMENVLGRRGLPEGLRAIDSGDTDASTANGVFTDESPAPNVKYGITVSEHALPHPYKKGDKVAAGRRDYGPGALCTDMSLCEDAGFCIPVSGNNMPGSETPGEHVYMVVADGVGSWRQYGVDPRLFAHKLVDNARKIIESDNLQRQLINEHSDYESALFNSEPIHPLDVIVDAWQKTRMEEISGSSTICVVSIDSVLNQLTASNLGDCGLMVVRHMDNETVGYMRERGSRDHRISDLQIAFLSQQQLKSFNLPYQLGFSGIPEHQGNFEHPNDATTFSIPLLPGDVIILATDGLFDNLELDDIVLEIEKWEDKWFGKLLLKDEQTFEKECMDDLPRLLVKRAREMSLRKDIDSPFALLAKDNDIMWSGGMPDDTTVLAARIHLPASVIL